jgi:hypothetical protein
MTNESIIAKSQGFVVSTEADGNQCPTNLVNVSNKDEGLDFKFIEFTNG